MIGLDPRADEAIYRRETRGLRPLALGLAALDLATLAGCLYAMATRALPPGTFASVGLGMTTFTAAMLGYLNWRHLRALSLAKRPA